MSVAFTREEDLEAAAAYVPDRPISPHENLVTPEGLAQLDAALEAAKAAHAAARTAGDVQTDKSAIAIAARDLRYFMARRATAKLVQTRPADGIVGFGSIVTFDRDDGRHQIFRIVGEDQADARSGSVSHVSPLARALLGKTIGDSASVAGAEIEIVAIARP